MAIAITASLLIEAATKTWRVRFIYDAPKLSSQKNAPPTKQLEEEAVAASRG